MLNALFYPFHLCHAQTLTRLLAEYQQIHFRDHMALQLSPLAGTLAAFDRMGDDYPDLVKSGRIVQGHAVGGPLRPAIEKAVNRDLEDPTWRAYFHQELKSSLQFQRGVVTFAQDNQGRSTKPADPDTLFNLQQPEREHHDFTVESMRNLSRMRSQEDCSRYEYGLALVKTAASLIYTIELCDQLQLVAVTDSAAHHRLLMRTCQRENINLLNRCIERKGY